VVNSVNGVKDVELKQNVFQHFDNSNFQRLFQNNEGRIQDLDSSRIIKI